ncbi:MAG: pyridoxal-dependent decarboxylase [Kangiellaceae bacterium]|nr:pyridoxal-dependent decarboxylase [Kangiellaceae bacterium]MCW9000120.1 pyridoxal-dependent decarboxylase [Kangiellaceae bacterium]MCW9016177.1 pyridoxal-dependent decarboxylase [Kangiellaceae bacterium]
MENQISATSHRDDSFLSSLFVGAHGENRKLLTQLLSEFLGEHFNWRQDFHSEDESIVSPKTQSTEEFEKVIEKTRYELHSLTEKLKHSAPIYNPRYLGHMASDLMLPALLAQLVTTLYNPNNSLSDIGETTIQMELDVGNQFAKLFGFNTDPDISPCAWGHVTSGGSDANYEALWNYRAVKYYPVALVEALNKMSIKVKLKEKEASEFNIKDPLDYSPWELVNLNIDQVLNLRAVIFSRIEKELGIEILKKFYRMVEENRLETIGPAQFFAEHYKCHQPVVLVPATAYRFWQKAMRLLGFGSASLVEIPVDRHMRMDTNELKRILERLTQQNIPVLAVVGVLGTRNFGSVDPIHEIVKLKDSFTQQGMCFYIHADASSGGYLKSLFVDVKGNTLARENILSNQSEFPSKPVYDSFCSLSQVDSITVAPHTLGYLPQGIGVFVARNREIVKLLNPSERNLVENKDALDLLQLGRYILDGSKPGANVTAAYVTHKVVPLTANAFGKVMSLGITNCEKFYHQIQKLSEDRSVLAKISIPFVPDTNVLCLAINPQNNRSLSGNQEFMKKLFSLVGSERDKSVQTRPFITSISRLKLGYFSQEEAAKLFADIGLDYEDDLQLSESHLMILRHSLNNPWLYLKGDSEEVIQQYCEFLSKNINKAVAQLA